MPEYKGGPLDADRGPGLGCFWIQAVALVIAMILAPLSAVLNWPAPIAIGLLFLVVILLLLPVRDDACLPRARASENEERAGGGGYCAALDLIEWTEDALLERGLARPFGDAVACWGGLERGVCGWIRGEVHAMILPPSTSQPMICSGAE